MKMTPKMIKKIKQYSSVLGAVVLALVMMAVPSFAEGETVDYSNVYATTFGDGLGAAITTANDIWRGCLCDGTSTSVYSKGASFDSSTGTYRVFVQARYNSPSYLLVSGAEVSNLASTSSYVTAAVVDSVNLETVYTSRYGQDPQIVEASLSDIPDDAVIIQLTCTDRISVNVESTITFTVTPVTPPVPTQSETVLDLGKTLLTTTLNYGNTLITWITANPIVMIGLGLYVLIALCGIVFKFLPGVR